MCTPMLCCCKGRGLHPLSVFPPGCFGHGEADAQCHGLPDWSWPTLTLVSHAALVCVQVLSSVLERFWNMYNPDAPDRHGQSECGQHVLG